MMIQSNKGSTLCSNSFSRPLPDQFRRIRRACTARNKEKILQWSSLHDGKLVTFSQQDSRRVPDRTLFPTSSADAAHADRHR